MATRAEAFEVRIIVRAANPKRKDMVNVYGCLFAVSPLADMRLPGKDFVPPGLGYVAPFDLDLVAAQAVISLAIASKSSLPSPGITSSHRNETTLGINSRHSSSLIFWKAVDPGI